MTTNVSINPYHRRKVYPPMDNSIPLSDLALLCVMLVVFAVICFKLSRPQLT